tara:strand:- start:95 stop:550 length:456 start_codon:yes stop_codon:yes gene_type:complete
VSELAYTDKTPCVGLCSTVYGDQVCRGCKRFSHEIIQWNSYASGEKAAVWLRLEQLLAQVVSARIEIVSGLMLRQALDQRKIIYLDEQPLACHVHRLLVRGGEGALQGAGVRVRPAYAQLSIKQLRDDIDQTFFGLSEAYYQRHASAQPGK